MVVICNEIINGQMSHCYTIRDENDCSSVRFHKVATFDTYDDARNILIFLPKRENFINKTTGYIMAIISVKDYHREDRTE